MNRAENEKWEEAFISEIIKISKKEFEPEFSARMIIKILWRFTNE